MSPQWDTGVLSHCGCQVLIKSNAKPQPNGSDVTNRIHHIWRTWWETIMFIWPANVLLDLVQYPAIRASVWSWFRSGNVAALLWAAETSCLSACVDRGALHECETLWREELERGRAMTRARSLLPKTKSLQPLTLRVPLGDSEIISHQDSWNCSMASKCAFMISKGSEKLLANVVCNKTRGRETDCCSTNRHQSS